MARARATGLSPRSHGLVAADAATQGIIIPPSHNAIIYSYAAGGAVSVIQLFMAGSFPAS
jgi:TRAP-type C4-dicarboxylate transport system permease large subunit